MVKHIYGNTNILSDNQRPNMFINELKMYVDYLKKEITDSAAQITHSQTKKWNSFRKNVLEGIDYYHNLFTTSSFFRNGLQTISLQLQHYKLSLQPLKYHRPKSNSIFNCIDEKSSFQPEAAFLY
jgi:hypothetical protein